MNDRFQTTRWTLLQQACQSNDAPPQQRAMNELCDLYWKPLYWFARRQGYNAEDAADRIQGFFHWLITGEALQTADQRKGRLRSYLLALLKGYLADQRKYAGAIKRGGGAATLAIDAVSGEEWLQEVNADKQPANEAGFDRVWAQSLLDSCLNTLREQRNKKGQAALFDTLKPYLLGDPDDQQTPIKELAEQLNMADGAVRVALHRLRQGLRELLRSEVRETLPPGESIESELRYLARVLATPSD